MRHITIKYDSSGKIHLSMAGNHVNVNREFTETHQLFALGTDEKPAKRIDNWKSGTVVRMPKEAEGMSLNEIQQKFRVSKVDGEMVELEQV